MQICGAKSLRNFPESADIFLLEFTLYIEMKKLRSLKTTDPWREKCFNVDMFAEKNACYQASPFSLTSWETEND